ncbi:FkbM family methyltransferase [Rhodococcus sp. H29-C3]|uniref:FkbM family methyltransferase n=1 Tax=Rhodococcus sp. H29-C3 TaxID=3046307 RepID=UPI0024BAAFF2|nr:FkbM family methyltransferase [Rhodococcus sp. H29-C3]MDJ0363348.1 FkbM family methyltransferase [Rhodococcus sp. H29-C3]
MSTWRTAAVATSLCWGANRLPFIEDEVRALREWVRPGSVCMDIGAEYGLYTWVMSALAGPNGHVHSVEPLPGPSSWLQAAAGLLGARNVTVHRTALGAAAGHGSLSLPTRRLMPVHGRAYLVEGSQGPGPNAEFSSARTVPATIQTLDHLASDIGLKDLSFVKADVEGAELAVLRGGADTLSRYQPTILLEIEERHLAKYGSSSSDVFQHLARHGYRCHRLQHGQWTQISRITDDNRNYLFTPDHVNF